MNRVSRDDREFLLERAFDRIFDQAGLFGTVDDGIETARRLAAIGVDEIACLIDFGVASDVVFDSLKHLELLQEQIHAIRGADFR